MRAGFCDITRATSVQVIAPEPTITSLTTERAVSRPSIPKAASTNACSLSWRACGAWSVATASIVPSASASRSAAMSSSGRSGGFTLKTGSKPASRSVGSSRWCGVTSAVTSMPWALAQRITSTEPAVETWATCTRLLVCRASITSRATMVSSAMPGQPGSPRRPESSPSWQQAVGPARSGSWECWEMTPPKDRTYSSARRITRGSCTHLPSSENTRTLARDRAIRPSSASSWPPRPRVTAPTGCTSTSPAARPRSRIRSAASPVSVTGEVFAIASTAVKPPSAAALEPVSTVSASSRPGSRRWVCRSTSPGRATSPSASITSAPVGASAT